MDQEVESPPLGVSSPAGDGGDGAGGAVESIVDPALELTDPTPDIHALFRQFNERFFEGRLASVELKWGYKMTSCAGVCYYEGRSGYCCISLSEPLLKLRTRRDLVQTLLHEMIHAYVQLRRLESGRQHGPEFLRLMERINREAGTAVSVFHDFYDEVEYYWQHWYRCDGRCGRWLPCFGNRLHKRCPPWPRARLVQLHRRFCAGTFRKVRRPERYASASNKALRWPILPEDPPAYRDQSTQTLPEVKLEPVDCELCELAMQTVPVVRDQATQTPPSVSPSNVPRWPILPPGHHDKSTQTLPEVKQEPEVCELCQLALQQLPVVCDQATHAPLSVLPSNGSQVQQVAVSSAGVSENTPTVRP